MSWDRDDLQEGSIQTVANLLRRPRIAALGAVALVFLALCTAYYPALNGQFLWDDADNITSPELTSWQGLGRIWFEWGATQTYYPFLHTVYWVEHAVWGDATLGYHLATILFHAVSVCLVYWIVRRLQIPGALLAAAIFAVHPVYVESLAWITEQKNTLSGMFYLGSILVYLHFDDDRRRSQYALALGLFMLSLFSKTTAVTLPVALLVILWWKRGALSWRRDLAPLVPWFALSLVFGIFTAWYEKVYVGAAGKVFELTWLQKCLLASRAVWFYLSKLFWPANLTFIYPRWEVNPAEAWQYVYPAGLLALFVVAWLLHRRWRAPLAALLYFVGTLFPLLGFFSTYIFTYTYACDHFQYLPSLGIVVLVSAGATIALRRLPAAGQRIGQGACLLLLSALAWLTWQQSQMYCDIITLYQTTIDRNPSCWMAHTNLGDVLTTAGRIDEAIEHCHQALAIRADNPLAHNNLGAALVKAGRPEEAIEQFQQAVRLNPNYSDAYNNLGILLGRLGRIPEAIAQFQQALAINPDYADAHSNLGLALFKNDQPQEAIEQFEAALRLRPKNAKTQASLAAALARQGRFEEAVDHYQQALQINPQFTEACFHLAETYAQMQQPTEAAAAAQQALELARAQGQAELERQISAWLDNFLAQQAKARDGHN